MTTNSHCPCIAISHDHIPSQCDEPKPKNGESVCLTCRYPEPVTPSDLRAAVTTSDLPYRYRYALYDLIDSVS
jgi:hypothetical protein